MLAWKLTGQFSFTLFLATLGSALAIQLATNFFNDAIDAQKGTDTQDRLGPTRVTASGLLSSKTVYAIAALFIMLAGLCAIPLVLTRGWPILAIGIPSLFLAYGYTGGPFPLAYLGLGELFVVLFFGVIAVAGSAFVQSGLYLPPALWLGITVGCLSAVLISINNLRDIEEDTQANKRTLAVRLGPEKATKIIFAEYLISIIAFYISCGQPDIPEMFFAILVIFLPAIRILGAVKELGPSRALNSQLALAGAHLVLFAIAYQLQLFLVSR